MLKVKVCGIRDFKTVEEVVTAGVDFVGVNFYEKSPRFTEKPFRFNLEGPCRTVAVFVNAPLRTVIDMAEHYDLVQLHGDESVETCRVLHTLGIPVIKAFGVSADFDFEATRSFEAYCDYFIFDRKTPDYGGSGTSFNWNLLAEYSGTIPFLLGGGISPADATRLQGINHPQLFGVDLNSKFEDAPGIKNISKIEVFVKQLKGPNGIQ